MCGIVGYVGSEDASAILLDGLKRLEYRGYDSCGIAVMNGGPPKLIRSVGRIAQLETKLRTSPIACDDVLTCGIGHTRWATHGQPSEENAHPHRDCTGDFLVVHNGIVENHAELRRELIAKGHRLRTTTDTEVLPHLIEAAYNGNLQQAVMSALRRAQGVYSILVMCAHEPRTIVAVRNGPPLIVGLGKTGNFIASDMSALVPHTRRLLALREGEIATIRDGCAALCDFHGRAIDRDPEFVAWSVEEGERRGYPHFMLKEIFEQPDAVRNTMHGRITASGLVDMLEELDPVQPIQDARRVIIAACGTSLHAGLVGKFMIERFAGIPVEVDYASEFRYRQPILDDATLVLAITQSGETADTLGAVTHARQNGATVISICNVAGSMAAQISDYVLYTKAGPEIGVASTKAFTTQLVNLYLFALYLARLRGRIGKEEMRAGTALLKRLPEQMSEFLDTQSESIIPIAEKMALASDALYLGRGVNYPIALEGALKLKEISYIHAEGYPAGEMKHGPIALIDDRMPVVVIAPQDPLYAKTTSNLEEVRARRGSVIAVASEHDCEIRAIADHVIPIPHTDPLLIPFLSITPLQLLAYHAAVIRGCDVDKPRNLAKSVTVE